MAGYWARIRRDIERWKQSGLIGGDTAAALRADIDANYRGRFSFGAVLAVMAAALFAAAILIFIAANWEVMPRLARVALLFGLIIAGYLGGALLKLAGRDAVGEGAWIVAAAAFGASLALIGQMYHLSGDEKQAMLLWCIATAMASAVLRSGALNVGAVLLAVVWLIMDPLARWQSGELPLPYLPLAAVLFALSFWTRSRPSRHLLLLSFWLFAIIAFLEREDPLVLQLVIVGSVALFIFGLMFPTIAETFLGLGSGLPIHALIGFLTGIGILQNYWLDDRPLMTTALVTFAGIIAALLAAGRNNVWLRRVAYAGFIFELCFVYVMLLGSMLGTAGFFVVGGMALSVLAWIITRIERRLSSSEAA